MTTGWIAEAANRWDRAMESDIRMADLSANQLADQLNSEVTACRLWKANWRNRIYRVTFGDGTEAVAKQACMGECHALEHEYHALHALNDLPLVEAVRIPSPIGYLRPLQTYVMEFVNGTPVDALVRRRRPRQLLEACQLAGHALGTIHRHWTRDIREIPVDSLVGDLNQPALRLSRCEQLALAAAVETLRGQVVPVGQPFLDYKPANVIYDRGRIGIIDPPEQPRANEILLWDVAVFGRGLRHELCKSIFRRPGGKLVRDAVGQFERAYRPSQPYVFPCRSFRLLVDIMELQRLGQLIALQQGKCRRARFRHKGRRFVLSRYLDVARFSMPVPLLRHQAHRLIDRLTHSLHSFGQSH